MADEMPVEVRAYLQLAEGLTQLSTDDEGAQVVLREAAIACQALAYLQLWNKHGLFPSPAVMVATIVANMPPAPEGMQWMPYNHGFAATKSIQEDPIIAIEPSSKEDPPPDESWSLSYIYYNAALDLHDLSVTHHPTPQAAYKAWKESHHE